MQEKNKQFMALLEMANLTQSDLAKELGISVVSVSRWNKNGLPQYAIAYLQLKAENIKLQEQIQAYKVIIKA